ncbi:MAG: hypothetical protein IPJ88_08805 [Myxococcales bacterium]|nr:MAG: hypothetical protein IPJ88_08805 [Myxococcales bacterium]
MFAIAIAQLSSVTIDSKGDESLILAVNDSNCGNFNTCYGSGNGNGKIKLTVNYVQPGTFYLLVKAMNANAQGNIDIDISVTPM